MAKKKEIVKEKEQETETQSQQSSLEKVAMLLLYLEAISPQTTKAIYEHIGEEVSQKILNTIASLGNINKTKLKPIINEAHNILVAQNNIIGGRNLSGKIIKTIFGDQIKDNVEENKKSKGKAFAFLQDFSNEKLILFFEDNSEAMAAFLFSLLSQDKAASLIPLLKQEKAQRIMEKALHLKINNIPILYELEEELKKEFSKTETGIQLKPKKQIQHLTQVLEMLEENQRTAILEEMKKTNKEIAEQIEQNIFTFPDLINCSEEDIAQIVADIKNVKALAFATHTCDEKLKEKLLNNISARQKEILDDELKTMPENVKEKDITSSQKEILSIARKLEKEEKIEPLSKGSEGKDSKEKKDKSKKG
ncbi:MAG: FliG C-terminal domain-containing protein [bacterium]